jgi:hypothetical protein
MWQRWGIRWQTLAALVTVVTVLHLVLLGWMPNPIISGATPPPVKFQARTLASVAPAQHQPAMRKRTVPAPSAAISGADGGSVQIHHPHAEQAASIPVHEPQVAAAPIQASSSVQAPEPSAVSAFVANPAVPNKVPESVVLNYELQATARGATNVAEAVLEFKQDGRQYDAKLVFRKFGFTLRTDHSEGVLGAGGLEPRRYSQKTRSEQAAHFEVDKGKITFSNNRPDAVLLPGAQDRLSVLLQLSALLAADPDRYPVGGQLQFQVVNADRADPWVFRVESQENLELPGATVPALKLHRIPQGDYSQRVEVWLSAQAAWLPVRVRITSSNGDVADQMLRISQR